MNQHHIVVISGSPTPGSRLNGLIQYAVGKWEEQGIKISYLNVADLPAEALLHADFKDEQILAASALVESASGVVIASPVYKASYTGILKAFLDLLPQKGLSGKIVLPLFIGGSLAHLLSLDYALKPVLSVMGCRHILGGVYAIDQWVQRLDNGGFELTQELQERLDRGAGEMKEEIVWLSKRNA